MPLTTLDRAVKRGRGVVAPKCLTVNRGALAGDPTIQTILSHELATLHGRALAATGTSGSDENLVSVALYGWLALVRAVCVVART